MKYTEFKANGNIVEFHNSVFGKETIFVNGEIISEKFSLFGTEHLFRLNEKQYSLKSSLQALKGVGIKVELAVNGKKIETKTIGVTKHTIIWVAIGAFLGYGLTRLSF